nr:uroporphyrinogen-III synthase [Thalassotalea sp. Y01]
MATNPLNILLTRPQPKSQELATVLAPIVNHIEICPLFEYAASEQALTYHSQFSDIAADIIIFVSPAAVEYALKTITIEMLSCTQVFAVGYATAKQLQHRGFSNIGVPERETSEGLLQLVALQHVKDKRVMIVRGNGGREHLAQELTNRGAIVTYNEVYKRHWLPLNAEQTIEKWRKQQINCIVVTSTQILEKLFALIDDLHFANQCTWLVVSERTRQNAHALGLTKVINCQGASHQHILASIKAQLMEN